MTLFLEMRGTFRSAIPNNSVGHRGSKILPNWGSKSFTMPIPKRSRREIILSFRKVAKNVEGIL